MKIYEILNEAVKKELYKGILIIYLPKNSYLDTKSLEKEFIGQGNHASVYNKKSNPNTIIKIADVDNVAGDATVEYIAEVLKHQNNPFLPRIYKAVLYIPDNPNVSKKLFIEMEKLHELSAKKLMHNIDPIFNSLGITKDLILTNKFLKKKLPPEVHDAIIQDMAKDDFTRITHWIFFDNDSFDFIAKYTNNPQFKQALSIVKKIAITHNKTVDMHTGNFMFRLTSVGPQLVLTDPLA